MEKIKKLEPLSDLMVVFIPFIIIFGIALIKNGTKTPGGGFQGGAVLAGVFISCFIVNETRDIDLNIFKLMEKFAFILISLIISGVLFFNFIDLSREVKTIYLIAINSLIAIKVCAGLSLIFYRFTRIERGD